MLADNPITIEKIYASVELADNLISFEKIYASAKLEDGLISFFDGCRARFGDSITLLFINVIFTMSLEPT